jgi:hypothetical protein
MTDADADTDRVSDKEQIQTKVTQEENLSKMEVISNQETSLWLMCFKFVK